MHGAGGGAPKGNRNALKHGGFTAEIETRRMVGAFTKQTRPLVGDMDGDGLKSSYVTRVVEHLSDVIGALRNPISPARSNGKTRIVSTDTPCCSAADACSGGKLSG